MCVCVCVCMLGGVCVCVCMCVCVREGERSGYICMFISNSVLFSFCLSLFVLLCSVLIRVKFKVNKVTNNQGVRQNSHK